MGTVAGGTEEGRARAWEALGTRSRAFLESVPVDLARDDFTELLILLKHSLDECVASQALLLARACCEGMVPLSRKILEVYVQLKYLARHPAALRHYALFERVKAAEDARRLLETDRELVAAGEPALLTSDQRAGTFRWAEREEAAAASFATLGVARRKVKDRRGREVLARTWFENYKGIGHIGGLAEVVGEKRLYARFYPAWSASQHGQSVSRDYALRLEHGRFATAASAAYAAEARELFDLSLLTAALAHLLLVRRFLPQAYAAEWAAALGLLEGLGLGEDFAARARALEGWL